MIRILHALHYHKVRAHAQARVSSELVVPARPLRWLPGKFTQHLYYYYYYCYYYDDDEKVRRVQITVFEPAQIRPQTPSLP